MNTRRLVLGVMIPTGVITLMVIPYLVVRDRLPDRLATHFDGSGTPDASMTPVGLFLMMGLLLVVPGLLMLIATAVASGRMPRPAAPFLAGLGAFIATLGAGIIAETVISHRDLSSWTDAANPWFGVVLVILGAAAVGVVASVVAKGLPYDRMTPWFGPNPSGTAPRMELADAERAVFVETISAWWIVALGASFIAAAVTVAAFGQWFLAVVLAFSALPVLFFGSFRVQADRTGLATRSAFLGFRLVKIPIEDIRRATILDVEPMKWGGWGYRGSLKLAGSAALVMRRGPGMHVELSDDRVFVVTLDDPKTAAAILNAHAATPVASECRVR